MLMKPLPDASGEQEAHDEVRAFAVKHRTSPIDAPAGPGISAGRIIGRIVVGVLGIFIGAFLALIVALGSGLIDVC